MQGTWIPVAYIVDGKPLSEDERGKIELTIKGNMSTFTRDGKTGTGTYKPDSSKKPRQLDIVVTAGEKKGITLYAIYAIEDDVLKICYEIADRKDRPKEFESKKGSGFVLETWKRKK